MRNILSSENIKRETSAKWVEEAEKGMEDISECIARRGRGCICQMPVILKHELLS